MRKSIGIDLDSTLNTLDIEWMTEYNKTYNDNLTREDMVRWEVHTYVKPECGNKIYDILGQPNFFRHLGVQRDSQAVTKWLSQYFDLYVVTAYDYRVCYDKAEWIKEFFPHIDVKNIIFCNNKSLINTDFLIDDGGHNLEGFKGTSLCYDAPWNRYLDNKYPRFSEWIDVQEYFQGVLDNGKN